jgi:hypothetical protein
VLNGDLGTELPSRWLVAFEDVLAVLPPGHMRSAAKHTREGRWERLCACYEAVPGSRDRVWDLAWRRGLRVDVVSFTLPPPAEPALRDWIERHNLPVCDVMFANADELAQYLAHLVDVQAVVHALDRPHVFGPRGVHVEKW